MQRRELKMVHRLVSQSAGRRGLVRGVSKWEYSSYRGREDDGLLGID